MPHGKVSKNCENCGVLFYCYRYRSSKARFCSNSCRASVLSVRHGLNRSRIYRIWSSMKSRCLNHRNTNYKYYGDRGVAVHPEWVDSFPSFKEWSVVSGYRDDLELDRIDTNGNYEPENCRWVTRRQNNQNTRKKKRDSSTSTYKGVYWDRSLGKWRASIRNIEGRSKHLGVFTSEEDAARSYDAAAILYRGEFACLNFINEREV